MTLDLQSLDALVLEPRAVASNHNDHFVELYDDDAALVESIRKFLSMGLSDGESAVVIATGSHRDAIEAELRRTVDLDAARSQGLYTSLDAGETLSLFLDGEKIDPATFGRVIGGVLEAAGTGGRKVRVFGEMVALLWKAGNVPAALDLEDRWNELAKSFDFRLFCAYPSSSFNGDDTSPLTGVCNRHSHVLVPR
jgi:hypothetical protein